MKSKNRQAVADNIAGTINQIRADGTRNITGGEALAAIIGIEEALPRQKKRDVRLELMNGLKGPDRNWTKYPNEIHEVMRDKLENPSEAIVYMYAFWRSWGFGRNYCRVSHKTIMRETVLRSKSTIQRAINALANRRFVVRCLRPDGDQDKSQDGALYRVISPGELIDGRTLEGVFLDDIPVAGVPIIGIPIIGIPENGVINTIDEGVPIIGIPNDRYTDNRYTDNEYAGVPIKGIPMIGTPEPDSDGNSPGQACTDDRYTDNRYTNKEDNIKDSLSREVISGFYRSIGQTKISNEKRERAEGVFEELIEDGFSAEDIQFAAQWTVENTEDQPYDFALVKHTIGQAVAAKKEEMDRQAAKKRAADKRRREEEEAAAAEEERQKVMALKAGMTDEERAELRRRAEEEIQKSPDYKKDFITDQLMEVVENEILSRQ